MQIRATEAVIDLNAIAHNIALIKNFTNNRQLMAVVKADAYGHGLVPVAKTCVTAGADALAVALVEEGAALRKAGLLKDILVLGMTPEEGAEAIVENNLSPALCTMESAVAIAGAAQKAGKTVKAHIKVNTGMNRIGVTPKDTALFVQKIKELDCFELTGIFTHFASADNPDRTQTNKQLESFNAVLAELSDKGIIPALIHAAASAAVTCWPESWFDMVRPGLAIYGAYPDENMLKPINLRQAMCLKTKISMVQTVPNGGAIGYGGTYICPEKSRIAVLPIGYADGYSRQVSNVAQVLVKGKRAPVRGKVCMDMTMIDISHIPDVTAKDEVVLLGSQGDDHILAEDLARWGNSACHEVFCLVSKRVIRKHLFAT